MANMSKEVLSAKTLKDLKKLASDLNIVGKDRGKTRRIWWILSLIMRQTPKKKFHPQKCKKIPPNQSGKSQQLEN